MRCKCEYCGKWGDAETNCAFCGAGMPEQKPTERTQWLRDNVFRIDSKVAVSTVATTTCN